MRWMHDAGHFVVGWDGKVDTGYADRHLDRVTSCAEVEAQPELSVSLEDCKLIMTRQLRSEKASFRPEFDEWWLGSSDEAYC
jgi:hypothetical protein